MEGSAEHFMALARSDEPLHPDLVPWLVESERIGTVLKHPLVFDVPYFGAGMANYRYKAKTKAIKQALAEEKWRTYVFLHERPYRLEALLILERMRRTAMTDQDYWGLVSSIWTDSENIWQNQEEWAEVFASPRKGKRKGLMDGGEYARWRRLPETVTVWRGAQREINEDGWSYSLDREQAEWFAKRFEWHESTPVVIEATVPRTNIVAYFRGRGEEEIVAYPHAVTITAYHEV